ncbi:MAG: type 4a pilus biogenesis protein PilO [Candidatus Omnitrophota bacterium]|jgi:Tfp pilus assembly protein PilO
MALQIDIKNPKQQMMILMALGVVLGVVLYFSLLLKPQVFGVFNIAVKNNKMKGDLKSIEGDISNIERYKKDIASYKDKVDKYERMLPAEQEIPSLLETLSSMARGSGVKIVGIMPVPVKESKVKDEQIYQEIPILISAKSGYHELGSFLANLENSDRFMKVVDIGIKSNKLTPKKHDVELLVLTYILLKR